MAKFTRRHYLILAKLIADSRVEDVTKYNGSEYWNCGITFLTNRLIETLTDDNPRFDAAKFREVCYRKLAS